MNANDIADRLRTIANMVNAFADELDEAAVVDPDVIDRRVMHAVAVYEETYLLPKHGHRRPASRTRQGIKRAGPREFMTSFIARHNASPGLIALRAANRLKDLFEQIVIDYPMTFTPELVAKAKANLDYVARL